MFATVISFRSLCGFTLIHVVCDDRVEKVLGGGDRVGGGSRK